MTKKNDKQGKLIESLHDNGGRRTVLQGTVAPKGSAPPHYHSTCEETLEVIEGELSVWEGKKKLVLKPGQSTKVQRNVVHYFKNESKEDVVMNVIIEPGSEGWETTVKIAEGLDRDGLLEKLSKFSFANVPYYNFMMKQTNTIPVGFAKIMFSFLTFLHGKKKIEKYEQEVIAKYCK